MEVPFCSQWWHALVFVCFMHDTMMLADHWCQLPPRSYPARETRANQPLPKSPRGITNFLTRMPLFVRKTPTASRGRASGRAVAAACMSYHYLEIMKVSALSSASSVEGSRAYSLL